MNRKGLIITSVLFVALISFIGLSVLSGTIFHVKILGAREKRLKSNEYLQAELIKYIHSFREKVYSVNLNDFLYPEEEFFNATEFPDISTDKYELSNSFNNSTVDEKGYRLAQIQNRILILSKKHKIKLEATIKINIISGSLPVTKIPLYINNHLNTSKDKYLFTHSINIPTIKFLTANDIGIHFNIDGFFDEIIGLNGKILNWSSIRERLGFPVNNLPLTNGLYILYNKKDENTIDSIFIQGDIQKMIFSINKDIQNIKIITDNKSYNIEYIPKQYHFLNLESEIEDALLFKEKLIVNGSIYSLISNGDFAFTRNTKLSLYSSGIIFIDSSLNTDNSARNGLRIITGNNEFFKKNEQSGRVIINNTENSEIKLSVSIIADEKITNNSKTTEINGNIFTDDLENNGVVKIQGNFFDDISDSYFTTDKFIFIRDFFISLNGEVLDEE